MAGFLSNIIERLGFGPRPTVLDISAVLDGRIVEICETQFISGKIIMPTFFVKELKSLASSKDPIKKAKGKRGLEVLNKIRNSPGIRFFIEDMEIEGTSDNHEKLAEFAARKKASVVTTDFSINKAGALKNVPVLNITDLAQALKPVVLPGEELTVFVMREGKDKRQGVGYLDDGTMVVIDDGSTFIGKRVPTIVQSILMKPQECRIIFSRLKGKDE